jgi:hypothetical protein
MEYDHIKPITEKGRPLTITNSSLDYLLDSLGHVIRTDPRNLAHWHRNDFSNCEDWAIEEYKRTRSNTQRYMSRLYGRAFTRMVFGFAGIEFTDCFGDVVTWKRS